MNVWQRLWQQQQHRRYRKEDKLATRGKQHQWFLLAGADQHPERFPEPQSLNVLYPPLDTFWADPFLWQKDGRNYIFFEDFPFASQSGRICVLEVDASGKQISEPVPVLEEPCHLSYPFLFEHAGRLYMMPEKSAANCLDLYRCDEFPLRWSKLHTMMSGMRIADATLLEHEGRWWLFASAKLGRVRLKESLFAFYADSPLSQNWTPHPANPLVRDLRCGRPGGRIIRTASGQLLRPAQDCLHHYGHGLRVQAINRLTPTEYVEETVWQLNATQASPDWRAMHHLDRHKGMLVMDAQRLIDASPLGVVGASE